MTKKYYSIDLLNQAQSVRNAWMQIDSKLKLGELTTEAMGLEIDQARTLDEEIDRIGTILVEKCNQRDRHYASVSDAVKRVRSAVKGIYGDDSSQYEMVGGTRRSEWKTPARKVAAAAD
jgi:hypothetical protein